MTIRVETGGDPNYSRNRLKGPDGRGEDNEGSQNVESKKDRGGTDG